MLVRPLANFAPVISKMKEVKCPTVQECFCVKFPPMPGFSVLCEALANGDEAMAKGKSLDYVDCT
jgi:hypothetical protein